MKKCQPLLKLIPVILLRVLSKWHQWVSLIQLSASSVSSSTSPCALSFSLGKKSHWPKLCPLPLSKLFRGYFLSWSAHKKQWYRQILRSTSFSNKPVGNGLLIQTVSVTPARGLAQKTHHAIVVLVICLCLTILLPFCRSLTPCYYLPFSLVMAGYVFGNGFPASSLKLLGCLQALEQK